MALINCVECRKEFSDKATACPECGLPTSYSKEVVIQNKNNEENVKKCSECGNFISSDQLTCQYCGNPDLASNEVDYKQTNAKENENIEEKQTVPTTYKSSANPYSIKKIMFASFIIIAVILALVLPNQYGEYKAINLVKHYNMYYDTTIDQLVTSWVENNTSAFQIYGWEAKRVTGNTYFVAFVFDEDQNKSNGYRFYPYEAELKTGVVRDILDNDILLKKYQELGFLE